MLLNGSNRKVFILRKANAEKNIKVKKNYRKKKHTHNINLYTNGIKKTEKTEKNKKRKNNGVCRILSKTLSIFAQCT